jgi:hypothetical protein
MYPLIRRDDEACRMDEVYWSMTTSTGIRRTTCSLIGLCARPVTQHAATLGLHKPHLSDISAIGLAGAIAHRAYFG